MKIIYEFCFYDFIYFYYFYYTYLPFLFFILYKYQKLGCFVFCCLLCFFVCFLNLQLPMLYNILHMVFNQSNGLLESTTGFS